MKANEFINHLEQAAIVAAIREAEAKTSGEIRVFISVKNPRDAVATARERFVKLGMHKTRERNGVLIYVAPAARKFAIIGDTGVHARCGEVFWQEVSAEISSHFRQGEFTQGILHGIRRAGKLLAENFPCRADDKNELPDEVEHD